MSAVVCQAAVVTDRGFVRVAQKSSNVGEWRNVRRTGSARVHGANGPCRSTTRGLRRWTEDV